VEIKNKLIVGIVFASLTSGAAISAQVAAQGGSPNADVAGNVSSKNTGQRQSAAKKTQGQAPETKTIYRQVMKDGSVLFTDVGEQGAKQTSAIPYRSTSNSTALQVASQQKEHWKRQADGFDQRQAQRDRDLDAARRERMYNQQMAQARDYGWYGPAPRVIYGPGVYPVRGHFPQQGVSGVGAAHNVPSSFIGSGFATSGSVAPASGAGRR
jgi:hypothetical protein